MDAATFREIVIDLARPSKALNREDMRIVTKISMMIRDFLAFKAKSLVSQSNHSPVLYSYGADGTTFLTRTHYSFGLGDEKLKLQAQHGI